MSKAFASLPPASARNSKAISGLVMGVVGCLSVIAYFFTPLAFNAAFFTVFFTYSWLISVPGLIFSIKGLRSERRGVAILGIIFSGITMIVFLSFIFIVTVFLDGWIKDY